MRIAIRADGGSSIGMGHIMRTLVLAKELAKTNEVFYVCRTENHSENSVSDKYRAGIEKIKCEGFNVEFINEKYILEDLKKIKADLLITDSYDVNQEYFIETKKIFNETAYIDDINCYYFDVNFLINQNANGEDLEYKVNDDTKLLVGLKYTMLRNEFRNVPKKIIKEKVKDIMITVGGSDPNHVTEQILNYTKNLQYNFHVVVGPSFKDSDNLKQFENDRVKLYYNANMYKIMEKCDIAVSACGSTLYEIAACGVPTLGIIIADNQEGVAKKLDELGAINNIGWYSKLTKDKFIDSFNELVLNLNMRKKMSHTGQNIINGRGVERIVKALTK
ncbi:UDP-2,4-diacetamido-2,4,6-trideoxy-beta-L-altropyranose hydrolase [Clostridium ganghwense]|uniref:UDP-2,4-diacetamido-2,4, 6-trideoxy-beta-L-altropyranose hydrolase n=1 Tax=Clostridium ganghwense TaxID=312089 RepID=A0ABT4CMX6_9CLOT|nr:UDP-2,4-diacetamido-2,4,6-trideoxy-beta-L-altropyranose hydrolase [Clostridium ganghwense]MCY6370405.1 UDP-2,4-diacetamido-2,4,6-trideoxy-beta-L-altropyranose hydrolase [Clostridium ganghwense]